MSQLPLSIALSCSLIAGAAHAQPTLDSRRQSLDLSLHREVALESTGGATGSFGFVSDRALSGDNALRIEYGLPSRKAILESQINVSAGERHTEEEPWGLKISHAVDGDKPLRCEVTLVESSNERWTTDLLLTNGSDNRGQWQETVIPLPWFKLVTWERRNGILEVGDTSRIILRLSSTSDATSGTLSIDSFQFVDSSHVISLKDSAPFALVDLSSVYDTDSIAGLNDPRDGDFNTGEWEPRTFPAELMPKAEVVTLSGIPFLPPPTARGEKNTIRSNRQTLHGFDDRQFSAAYFLAASKFGDQSGDVTIHYTDGSTSTVALYVSDWSMEPMHEEAVAIKLPYAYHLDKRDRARTPRLFVQSIMIDSKKKLARIELPQNDFLRVFAITLTESDPPQPVGALEARSRVERDPRYALATRMESIDFSEPVVPVGVFGGAVVARSGSHSIDIPTLNGFLCFVVEGRHLPRSLLGWHNFQNRSAPFPLGGIQTDMEPVGPASLDLLDSTSLRHSIELVDGNKTATMAMYASRAWPAAFYDMEFPECYWYDADEGGELWTSYIRDGKQYSEPVQPGTELPTPDEPWILLWHRIEDGIETAEAPGNRRDFAAPMLLVLEKKPARINATDAPGRRGTRLHFQTEAQNQRISVMPLYGIRRVDAAETRSWAANGIPDPVVVECRAWAARLQRFPIKLQETQHVDESTWSVTLSESFEWLQMKSDWEMEPVEVMPYPPAVILASDNGYPVEFQLEPQRTSLSTLYGPFTFSPGRSTTYTLPLSPYTRLMPVFGDVDGHPLSPAIKERLLEIADRALPEDLSTHPYISDIAWDLAMLRLHAPLHLIVGPNQRRTDYGHGVVRNALKDQNLKIEKEPVTSQYFLMDDRFWARNAAYDKEWCIGFMLQGLWSEAYYLDDFEFIAANWQKVQGLYRYYQIFFDWPTGSTWTMTTGIGANSDGIRIAYEGMLATARMARAVGDEALWNDAIVRTARQGASLYASWFASPWAAENGYAMKAGRHVRYSEIDARFSPDHIWSEYFTNNASHRGDFFQATHALFAFNAAHLMFLHDTGLAERFVRPWTFEHMPELHPHWCDGNVRGPNGHFYGDGSAMCHLIARALLFSAPVEESLACLDKATIDTEVMKQWYTPIGLAPIALASMVTAIAPIVQAPVGDTRVLSNRYSASTRTQNVVLRGTRNAESLIRIRFWQSKPVSVSVNGEAVDWSLDAALSYATIPLSVVADTELSIEVQY